MSGGAKAYLSCSEADEARVRRLRRRLQAYVVPAAARAGGPARLGRFIPDANSARSGDTAEHMAAAEWLIVFASPNAFNSARVNSEIETYLVSNPVGRFLMVVLDGEPMQVLPPRLRGRQGVTADLRPQADGAELGFLKLVGALTSINVGALRDHEAARARARSGASLALTGALAIAAAAGAVSTLSTMQERDRAATMARQAIDVGASVAAQAGDAEQAGAADNQSLAQAEQQFEDLFSAGLKSPDFVRQRAHVLVAFAGIYERRGESENARARALAAIAAFEALPGGERRSGDLVQALSLVSRAERAAGRDAEALDYAGRAVVTARALAVDPQTRAALADALGWQGDLHVRAGAPGDALPLFAEAAPLLAAAQDAAPADAEAIARLQQGLLRLGDAQAATDDHAGAISSYEQLTALLRTQLQSAPRNNTVRAALGTALAKLAHAQAARNDNATARAPADESLAIARQFSAAAPDDAALQRELAARVILAARVRTALGAAGADLMEEAVAAARTQALARPADLAAQVTLADMLAANGARLERGRSYEEALEAWREAAQVRRRLRQSAQANLAHTLAVAEAAEHSAAISARLDDQAGALSAHNEAIRMRRALVAAAPGDRPSRAALAGALHLAGLARLRAENNAGALAAFDEAARLRITLSEEDTSDQAMAELALESLRQLMPLQTEANATTGARRSLTTTRDILSRLAAAHPSEARYSAALRRTEAALQDPEPAATQ